MSLNIGVLCDIHWDNFILIHTKFKKINSEYFRLHTLYGKTLDIINCCASKNLLTLIKHSSDNLSKTLYNLLKLCDIWLLFTNQIEFLTPISLIIEKCKQYDIKYIIVSEYSRTKDYYSFEKVHEKFKDNLNDISRCLNKLTVNSFDEVNYNYMFNLKLEVPLHITAEIKEYIRNKYNETSKDNKSITLLYNKDEIRQDKQVKRSIKHMKQIEYTKNRLNYYKQK